jgi:hypothetical protein
MGVGDGERWLVIGEGALSIPLLDDVDEEGDADVDEDRTFGRLLDDFFFDGFPRDDVWDASTEASVT